MERSGRVLEKLLSRREPVWFGEMRKLVEVADSQIRKFVNIEVSRSLVKLKGVGGVTPNRS